MVILTIIAIIVGVYEGVEQPSHNNRTASNVTSKPARHGTDKVTKLSNSKENEYKRELYALKETIVTITSKRLAKVIALNKKQHKMNYNLKINNEIIIQHNSKKEFDNFDYYHFVRQYLIDYEWGEIIKCSETNELEWSKYAREIKEIIDNEKYNTPVEWKSISVKEYQKVEKDLIREKTLKEPPTLSYLKVVSMYSSPAGRNTYRELKVFDYEKLTQQYEDAIQRAEQQKQYEQSVAYQRKLLTSSLRYEILKRDNFKCQICGLTAQDGSELHVDHIKPVSKGGKTTEGNLRALCRDCNLGKSDKYDPGGVN